MDKATANAFHQPAKVGRDIVTKTEEFVDSEITRACEVSSSFNDSWVLGRILDALCARLLRKVGTEGLASLLRGKADDIAGPDPRIPQSRYAVAVKAFRDGQVQENRDD